MALKVFLLTMLINNFHFVAFAQSGEDCDTQSDRWHNVTHSELAGKCESLSYDKQYCTVNKNELDCMQQRADTHDLSSCKCHRGLSQVPSKACLYVEFCAFADPEFKCNPNYTCTVDEDDIMSCACNSTNCPKYTKKCRRSFIHCLPSKECYTNFLEDYHNIYKDSCEKELTDAFGNGVTIYCVVRAWFNGKDDTFEDIQVLKSADGDEDNLCKMESVYPSSNSSGGEDWKIVVPAVIVFILIVSIVFGSRRFRQIRKREIAKIDGVMDNTFNEVRDYVLYKSGRPESQERSVDGGTEVVYLISPITASTTLPNTDQEEGEREEIHEEAPGESVPENILPDDKILSPDSLQDTDQNRIHSFENSSYTCGGLPMPDLGSVFSDDSSKNDTESLEASYVDSTRVGYMMKTSIDLVTSVGQPSRSDLSPTDKLLEQHYLHAMSEDDSFEPSNSNQNYRSSVHGPVDLWSIRDPNSIDNPTYLS